MSVLYVHDTVVAAGYQVGTGRLVPSLAAVLALCSVVAGVRAVARRHRAGRPWTVAALVAGLVAAAVGAVHAATAAGGLGTGNGLAGAVVAVALGVLGAALCGVALARGRRGVLRSGAGRTN
jgi:hypothetical protein